MDDLISRQDAIEVLTETIAPPSVTLDTLVMRMDALPSADAVRKPDYSYEADMVRRLKEALSAEAVQGWIPCSERLPSAEDCPMDCMVTRRSQYVGNYTDMAVAEADGTWTHENWKAITINGNATCISTRDADIIAWMPLPEPYREDGEKE